MSEQGVAAAFAEHGKWISRFVIDGVEYGGSFDAINDPRLELFFATFAGVGTILELGSLEGGHTIGLARKQGVKRVLGLEGRKTNLARARVAARLLKARHVAFAEADLENAELAAFGKFDAIYCCGILYHLPEPWKLLQQCTAVSPRLFLWTHYSHEDEADVTSGGYKGRLQPEGGLDEPLSGLSPQSFWPTIGSLVNMLTAAGFPVLHILSNDPTQSDGPAITIAAFADGTDELARSPQAKRRKWWRRKT